MKTIFCIVFILTYNIMGAQINQEPQIVVLPLKENGFFPNNETLPVLIYKQIFILEGSDPAGIIEKLLMKNNWGGSWRNGIYDYHHYHSTAHEVLGVYSGWAEVELGGPGMNPLKIEKGDLVVLPAGTAHKRRKSGDGFAVVGAYPDKQKYDMNYGKEDEYEISKVNIQKVPLPANDPVFGKNGEIKSLWNYRNQ